MTVDELMSGRTISASWEGWVTNDDFVLAVDCGSTAAEDWDDAGDFAVAEVGISNVGAAIKAETADKTYIRAGKSSIKTGASRAFSITADRYIGDDFQDFCESVKYLNGNDCIRKYVYFNIRTGKGEKGEVSIIVNSDGSGESGASAEVTVDLKKTGAAPTAYTYVVPTPPGP